MRVLLKGVLLYFFVACSASYASQDINSWWRWSSYLGGPAAGQSQFVLWGTAFGLAREVSPHFRVEAEWGGLDFWRHDLWRGRVSEGALLGFRRAQAQWQNEWLGLSLGLMPQVWQTERESGPLWSLWDEWGLWPKQLMAMKVFWHFEFWSTELQLGRRHENQERLPLSVHYKLAFHADQGTRAYLGLLKDNLLTSEVTAEGAALAPLVGLQLIPGENLVTRQGILGLAQQRSYQEWLVEYVYGQSEQKSLGRQNWSGGLLRWAPRWGESPWWLLTQLQVGSVLGIPGSHLLKRQELGIWYRNKQQDAFVLVRHEQNNPLASAFSEWSLWVMWRWWSEPL